jgi:hypothetical protein
MKALKITQMILRTVVLLALILGITFWINPTLPDLNPGLKGTHMLLGILAVISLWVIGLIAGRQKGGSFGLAVGAFALGLVVVVVGMGQTSWKTDQTSVELFNSLHLVLGLATIGLGEMIGGRARRLAKQEA